MKLHAITIAIAIAGFNGTAAAGNHQVLPTVHIFAVDIAACTPPTDAPACEDFHRWIRANFSEREIGMLFGARTSYPESLTGGIEHLQKRYQALVLEYVAAQNKASEPIAAK